MFVLATGLPVEDDISGGAAVNPEVAVGTGARYGFVEIVNEGFVCSNVAGLEHALFHLPEQQAAPVSNVCGGVSNSVGVEVHAVTLFGEKVLLIERKMIEVLF